MGQRASAVEAGRRDEGEERLLVLSEAGAVGLGKQLGPGSIANPAIRRGEHHAAGCEVLE